MTQSELAQQECVPCKGGVPPLKGEQLQELAANLNSGWEVVDEHHLHKTYTFKDFAQALAFTNKVGAIAEEQNHHPDIQLGYGEVGVTMFTHKIDGLTKSDFVFAAKVEEAAQQGA
ncbi:MAG: 4a-hydroxytetrahydrobiopterin dehydratase [Candidatus Hydrogenedentota bacterium]